MAKRRFFKVGYISRTHGLKGGVVLSFAQEPIEEPEELYMEQEAGKYIPLILTSWSARTDIAFVTFEGIDHIDQATALRGQTLYMPVSSSEKTATVFHGEALIGYEVIDDQGAILGKVSRYSAEGGRQLLLVATEKGEIIIPADGPFIVAVNHKNRKIRSDLPEGFLDI